MAFPRVPPRRRARVAAARARVAAALLGIGTLAAACGSSGAGPLPAAQILRSDPAARLVRLHLVAGQDGTYGGFNFDGYGAGGMTVTIPTGWRVVVTCTNASTTLTHSCAVVHDAPVTTTRPPVAFGAETPNPTAGLAIGTSAQFSFVASRPGRYRIACLVTAHEADGMWDWLVVRTGVQPSVRTSAPAT